MVLVALLRVETVRDDHLCSRINRGLCVVTLDEPFFAFHDTAFGIGEVLLRLGVRFVRGWCGWSSRFLFAPLLLGFGLRLGLRFRRRPCLGLELGLGGADSLRTAFFVGGPIGQLVALAIFTVQLILFGIGRLGSCEPLVNLGFQLRRTLLHALVAHRFMLGCVGFDLGSVK